MTLRTRLIALFVVLALAPFVIASVLLRQQSATALRALVGGAVEDEARWVARSLERELIRTEESLRELAAQQPLRSGDLSRWVRSDSHAVQWVEVRSSEGILRSGRGGTPAGPFDGWTWCGSDEAGLVVSSAEGAVRIRAGVAPGPFVAPNRTRGLGPSAQLIIQSAERGGYVWESDCVSGADSTAPGTAPPPLASDSEPPRLTAEVMLDDRPVTVWSSARLDDFQMPLGQPGVGYWLVVLVASLGAAVAFTVSIHRVTRSLEELAEAAEQIGAGNFRPELPEPGRDEAGRLSLAIGSMAERLRETVEQIGRSGRMAVVGELASYLSHEIRNPLSSIQLNLQGIRREVARDAKATDAVESVDICLREVRRLDRVVSSVLKLGRWRAGEARPVYVHAVLADSLGLVAPQFEQHGVQVETVYRAEDDLVRGDPEELTAAFLNLFLNSGDAMSNGGELRVVTESGDEEIRVTISDTGGGIPESIRKQIWEPFFTTREEGSGIGLPLAVRTIEEHDGSLALLEREANHKGATFVIRLPLARPDLERTGNTRPAGTKPEGAAKGSPIGKAKARNV